MVPRPTRLSWKLIFSAFFAGVAALVSVTDANAQAQAGDPLIDIAWEAPPGCPDAASVRASVASLVGASANARRSPEGGVSFHGVAAPIGSRWQLRVQIRESSPSQWKTLEADRCDLLAEAFALIIASALDPSLAANQSKLEPTEPPPIATAERAGLDQRGTAGVVLPETAASGASLVVGPLFALGVGLLPSPSIGLGAAVGWQKALRWQLSGIYWPEQQTEVVGPLPGAAGVRLFAIQPAACAPLGGKTFSMCAGAEVGQMSASGADVPLPTDGASLWLALSAALAAELPVGQTVGLRARIGLGIPLLRPRFLLENVAGQSTVEVFRPLAVAAIVTFEPYLRLFSTEPASTGHGSIR
jgi:hypothetical protein